MSDTQPRSGDQPTITELPLTHLYPRDELYLYPQGRARPVSAVAVTRLAGSMREVGVLKPLIVRPTQRVRSGQSCDAWEIIAGRHRFEAARKIGLTTVPCIVVSHDDLHAELVMIDENLMRAELSPALRASQTSRRKQIYEELHPETKNGANQHTRVGEVCQPTFADATAAATGKSARTVRQDAERGRKVSEEVLDLIRGTALDTGTYLDKLKALPPSEQVVAAERDLRRSRQKANKKKSAKQKRKGSAQLEPKSQTEQSEAAPSREQLNLTDEVLETLTVSTVETIKEDLLRFSDEDLEDLRPAIDEEIADRRALAVGRTGA